MEFIHWLLLGFMGGVVVNVMISSVKARYKL